MNPVKHVAIIMDGNGRWGLKHKQSRNAGHRAGLNAVDLIINQCIHHKIEFLTLYTFSSENWKRPKNEITFLFKLLESFLRKKINKITEKDVKLKFIGELSKLPINLQKLIKLSEKKTFNKKTLQVNIALNYGSKIELINTIKKIKQKIKFLTLYTFSSENWKRPKNEITFLFKLLENFLKTKIDKIIEKDIKLKFIGVLNKLPPKLQKIIQTFTEEHIKTIDTKVQAKEQEIMTI